MSFGDEAGEAGGAGIGFATARGRDWPSVRQYNVFLANRVGALLDLVREWIDESFRAVAPKAVLAQLEVREAAGTKVARKAHS